MTILSADFYARSTLTVAQELLGQLLVHQLGGQRLCGRIIETEAYIGNGDTACHAGKGRTSRTEVMFGPPGYAYVYLIYGMYYMLNLVTEPLNFPAAVLIRAIEPVEGVEAMRLRRQKNKRSPLNLKNLTNGPGKLCQALGIDRSLNSCPVTGDQKLWVETGALAFEERVASGPRVGINYADYKDQIAPWRFWVRGNKFVST